MSFIDPDILSDEGAIAEAKLAGLADRIPGWDPHNADLEAAIAEADSSIDAAMGTLIKDEARDAYGGFGRNVLGVQRHAAQVATGTATFTLTDTLSHTIPDGFELVMETADGDAIAFATVGETAVPAGAGRAEGVQIVALDPGPDANGLSGVPRDIEALTFVDTVVVDESTSDGADEEPLADWLDRIVRRARRRGIVAITLDDYADIPLDVEGVARCLAINNYDPGAGDDDEHPGHVTIVPIDASGADVSPTVGLAAKASVEGEDRALQITVHTAGADRTRFDVSISVRPELGADEAALRDDVAAAINDLLHPSRHGLDTNAPGRWRRTSDPIRDYDVAFVADSVPACAGVVEVTFDDSVRSDLREIELAGWAPLPEVGTVTVTVVRGA